MALKKFILLHIVFFWSGITILAQVPDSVAVDTTQMEIAPDDSLPVSTRTTIQKKQDKQEETGTVTPWKEQLPFGAQIITNDSLLRWQIWPNWGDYQAYRSDAISFRQGSIGRVDAFHINGYEPHEQRVEMEGIRLNNPITGLPNYNLLPHRKIGIVSENYSGNYISNIRLRDFYIIKPISYLNYDEADGAYRNLEFLVSQNFTERTNLELSYWDRRGGGYYPNSGVEGSQVVGRVYHHLNKQFLIRGMYLRNQLKRDEPFGYSVSDPSIFPFDEFTSIPLSSNGESEFTRWDLVAGIYHRADTSAAEDAGLEASVTKNKKELTFPPDTLSWDIRTLNARLFKRFSWNRFSLRGEINTQQHALTDGNILSRESWFTVNTEAGMKYQFTEAAEIYSNAILSHRSGGSNGYDAGAGLKAEAFDRLKIGANLSLYSRIPTMQAMYWNSGNYRGNSGLRNEEGISITGNINFELTPTLTIGGSGRFKSAENATFLTPDSTFTNSEGFQHMAATVFGKFENHLFEVESSGTFQQFNYSEVNAPVAALNNQDQIIWLRNSAFIKGYVFDRATFLKIGVKTLLSPFFYAARTYNTELGFWQGNSTYQELPPFFRLDGELSARVRGIMVVLRWENALDGIGQAGYFEAAGFPMPPRRLIVGIRAQFRN